MMKRLICILLALALGAGLAATADETVTEIYDMDGLLAMAKAPNGRYRLMNDIDMGGVDWTPIAFSGELDGDGHGLYNLTVASAGAEIRLTRDGNMKKYETEFAGLFSTLENATVRNLRLVGADVRVENDAHCFAAILAGYVDRSEIREVSVSGRVRMNSYGVMVGVGGLAGFGCGAFDRCDAKVELVFEDRNFNSKCEEFMGGVLACGIGSVTACVVDIDGYDSCHGYVHNGGLVGMYYHCGTKYASGSVSNNIRDGRIRFFEDNKDRRAYCKAVIGESLSDPKRTKNNFDTFVRDEVKTYDTVLLPEQCDTPEYVETVVAPSGGHWGYTRHECSVCGYHWTDSYTAP